MTRFWIFALVCVSFSNIGYTQYSPPAGQPGSTAVHKDSSAIVRWANAVTDLKRGAADIANGWGTLASYGDSTGALGYANGGGTDVVSLGDSGYVTLSFPYPIMNGPGNDFAVFENGFDDSFLEFAFVEVSSDGISFVRFPAISLVPSTVQTESFGATDTELIHNLAGKFKQGYGTPFDLQDLVGSTGLNLDSIRFVRIVDVIGSVDAAFASYDSQGNKVNDPYPTDFASGGFDLDGVGVMNENNIYASAELFADENEFVIYPNPSNGSFYIQASTAVFDLNIFDLSGKLIVSETALETGFVDFSSLLDAGVYFVRVNESELQRLVVVK